MFSFLFFFFFYLSTELLHDVNVLGLSVVCLGFLSSCSGVAYWQFYNETVVFRVAVIGECVFFFEDLYMEVQRSDKGSWGTAVDRCFYGSVFFFPQDFERLHE